MRGPYPPPQGTPAPTTRQALLMVNGILPQIFVFGVLFGPNKVLESHFAPFQDQLSGLQQNKISLEGPLKGRRKKRFLRTKSYGRGVLIFF